MKIKLRQVFDGTKLKSSIKGLFFIIFFISPVCFSASLPNSSQKKYVLFLLFGYIICAIYLNIKPIEPKFRQPLLLTAIFFFLGILNLLIRNSNAFFNIIGPIIALLGYCFIATKQINIKLFNLFLLYLYIFFYITYYKILPNYFFRPGFNEDIFESASSNTIPISLNITLYAYMICDRFYKNENKIYILLFSIINFVLIFIQQSRGGFVIALILITMAIFHYSKRSFMLIGILYFTIGSFCIIKYQNEIESYFEFIGTVNAIEALSEDIRGEAQKAFFKDITLPEIILGHGPKQYAGESEQTITYTFNVFLEMWNKYGLLIIVIFIFIFIYRIFCRKEFEYPVYFFIPFFLYSMFESIYFPSYYDCIIYTLIFTKKFQKQYESQII